MLVRNLKGCPKIMLSHWRCRLSRRLGGVCGIPDIIIIFSKLRKEESNVCSFKRENNIGVPKTWVKSTDHTPPINQQILIHPPMVGDVELRCLDKVHLNFSFSFKARISSKNDKFWIQIYSILLNKTSMKDGSLLLFLIFAIQDSQGKASFRQSNFNRL